MLDESILRELCAAAEEERAILKERPAIDRPLWRNLGQIPPPGQCVRRRRVVWHSGTI